MDTGGLAQMSHAAFNTASGLGMPSGLASRRGGQNIKPLSFEALNAATADKENGAPTPRTSRSHLLAGLRTAPKSATSASFPANAMATPNSAAPHRRNNRNSMTPGMYDNVNLFNGPKTAAPHYGAGQATYNNSGLGQQLYTADQVLAPPQIHMDEAVHERMDPGLQAQLISVNNYLSEQQQRLQQQLRTLQAAAQQFQGLNQMQMMPQGYPALYQQQQQQLQAMQTMMASGLNPSNVYAVYDPATGQQTLYVDQSQQAQINAQLTAQINAQLAQQAHYNNGFANVQLQQQAVANTPVVQVSPPPPESARPAFRTTSPPRRFESPHTETHAPLPPPSANAFRRGHKKTGSTSHGSVAGLSVMTDDSLKSPGPKSTTFPLTPMSLGGYGPGQARAGEHPIRQPRNPPSMDELKMKPTAKHEGSKNFAARTRRSALSNLVRAGLERRKETRSSGSISPISEHAGETMGTPMTDNDSDSVRSGSGSLVDHDDADGSLPSSRTSTGSWGAIGSDRPISRQKANRASVGSNGSVDDTLCGSFANLLKIGGTSSVKADAADLVKSPMMVLTSAEKRKLSN